MYKLSSPKLLAFLLTIFGIVGAVHGQKDSASKSKDINEAKKTVTAASNVFNQIMKAPDKAIPKDLLDRAEAIAIFPGVINAAFIFGGRGGVGIISRRTPTGWSAPAFFKLGGGSFGFQIGGEKIAYVMLIMNNDGLKGILEDKFEMGGEVSLAAGPIGRSASATTNPTMDAAILSYSRTKGLFAGVALKGAVITPDNDRNEAVYGHLADWILTKNSNELASPSYTWIVPSTLTRHSSRRGNNLGQ